MRALQSFWVTIAAALVAAGSVAEAQTLAPLGPLEDGGAVTYFIADADRGRAGAARRHRPRSLGARGLAARGRRCIEVRASRRRGRRAREALLGAGGRRPIRRDAAARRGRSARRGGLHPPRHGRARAIEIATRAGLDALFRDTIVYLTCLHELGHALGLAPHGRFRRRHVFLRLRRRHRASSSDATAARCAGAATSVARRAFPPAISRSSMRSMARHRRRVSSRSRTS